MDSLLADPLLDRREIISVWKKVLEPLDYVQAFWEAGAISFGRVDEWSDIDLYLVVDDVKSRGDLRGRRAAPVADVGAAVETLGRHREEAKAWF